MEMVVLNPTRINNTTPLTVKKVQNTAGCRPANRQQQLNASLDIRNI